LRYGSEPAIDLILAKCRPQRVEHRSNHEREER
jgi:hypothetical protein